jgi:transposase
MAQNFLSCDREQVLLMPPSLSEWLAEDHFAWFVLDAVDELDLAAFYGEYRDDGWGRAAHDPAMMVALLVYAYAVGERSSRRIERHCCDDVAFRVIAANRLPDHATIARFRVRHEAALGELFAQVLGLCVRSGLVDVGVVAVDGTKLAAAASERETRTYDEIAAEILAEAGRIDAAEDEQHGEARGDELPDHLAKREGRQAWIKEALRRQRQEREDAAEAVPQARAERLARCRDRLVADWRAERQAHRDYEAWRRRAVQERGRKAMGPGPKPATLPEQPAGKVNLTDPDSRNMKTPRGYLQGYNAQAVTTERQIVIAAEVSTEGSDFQLLEPMIAAAERELDHAGVDTGPTVVLADAGYWSNHHIDALRARGMTPLVAPDAHTRAGPRRGRVGGPYDFMRRVLSSDTGKALYGRRQWMVEPVFADIKHNRRAERLKRRGIAAARSEWRLLAATHNLLKLHRAALTPAAG